ncbi:MAG: prephenate dehydrogenase [Terriglobia bacterium]
MPQVMVPDSFFRRVAIIGLGLVGGSWGLALKDHGFSGVRMGCDRPEVLRRAIARGAVDEAQADWRRAVDGAGLVILAMPVGPTLMLLDELNGSLMPGALVTDTGSTKTEICLRAQQRIHGNALFIGGHPLAGKERSSIDNAEGRLFESAVYVLTPARPESLQDPRTEALSALIASIGAKLWVMDASSHDRALAYLSHLPQLLSTALAGMIAAKQAEEALSLELAASGFRDITRLAESPYSVWRDICATNAENIRDSLDALIAQLERVKRHLTLPELERDFEQALELREKLRERKF